MIAAVVLALGIGTVIGSNTQNTTAANEDPATTASPSAESNALADLARRDDADPFAMGAVDAPVVIIEYADFTCKYCGAFAEETLPTLIEEYIDAGHVRMEWRDTPILSESSVSTAIAGRAAAQQDLFWQFYEVLYAHTYTGDGDFSRDRLLALAGEVDGLDLAAFETGLDDPELAAAVEQEGSQSRALGVTSTPTFVVGEQVIQGAQPIEVFRQIIDAQLEEETSQ
ncbi:DSBA oxidoreductase [Intrasporangium chromatireducens Q5-1]|uniref:DSBA oxidoreductase n=1 Tax=Intrasporangium chromatireducens Q5-1 TaxID=584657 RepID=W9GQP4_9MICO|nr:MULTISPECIES: thioredoxin domain-containing protein [Actinomycetes]EWT07133.1 DSBA oxidoreductase [Intrasporangium chromatireducens Q5-1]